MDFPVTTRDRDRILQQEGVWVGGRIGDVTVATPNLGTIIMSTTYITGGTFNRWIHNLEVTASIDCEILMNIRLANGFVNESNLDLKGVTNKYLRLRANVTRIVKLDRMLLYNQVIQFIFQKYTNGASGALNLTVSWDAQELFMNRNMYAPYAVKILADSIGAGADSETTPDKPYGSHFSQVVFNHFGATYDVKGINMSVGGVTANGMNKACITGYGHVDNANLVMVALGTNPDANETVFGNAITAILNRERVYHPDAWQMVCAPIMKANAAAEALMVTYRGVLQNIVQTRADPKLIYCPLDQLGILPGVIESNVHPNQSGHDMMYLLESDTITDNNVTL